MCEALAERVKKQLTHPKRRQVLLQLLGEVFTSQYLQGSEYSPSVLVSTLPVCW